MSAPDPEAVLEAFGLAGELLAYDDLAGAWSNRVRKLTTTSGAYLVKEIRNPWGVRGWRRWLDDSWRLELAARDAGVPLPAPVAAPDGGPVALVRRTGAEAAAGGGAADGATDDPSAAWVRVHRWVDGRAPDDGPVTPDLARWVGAALATVHGLALGPLDAAVYPAASRAAADRWPDLVRAATGTALAATLAVAEPWVRRTAALLPADDVEPTVLAHGDLDPRNVLLSATGPALCDWDVALPVVPARDVARAAVTFAGWSDRDVARAVVASYADVAGPPRPLRPDDLGATLAVHVGWLGLLAEQALGRRGATDVERAGAAERLQRAVAALPRRVEVAESLPAFLA